MKTFVFCFLLLHLFACKTKIEKILPKNQPISESVYASGILKAKDQYQVFSVNPGLITKLWVTEGQMVKKGDPLFSLNNALSKINRENANINAAYNQYEANQGKIKEALLQVNLAKDKMQNDSMMYLRQMNLWKQEIGTSIEFEQRQLAFQSSKTLYASALVKYEELVRQLKFSSSLSAKNLELSTAIENDYLVRAEIDGQVFSILKKRGEMVGPQIPLATMGNPTHYTLEMQVDEFDILKIKPQQRVLLNLDSYQGQVFEATVTKINPIMNERSKTFLVEATFSKPPALLYPNISFEASILVASKASALLIPRNYLINDSFVIKENGGKTLVKTGLKDYQQVEIREGIAITDYLIKP